MMPNQKNIMLRFSFIILVMVLIGIAIICKAGVIMFAERQYWKDVADRFVKENVTVRPTRGNIISSDGQLMASSLPEYKIYMDFMINKRKGETEEEEKTRLKLQHIKDSVLYANLDTICKGLHEIFPDKSAAFFKQHIKNGRKKESRSWLLYPKRISYIQYKEAKRLEANMKGNVTEEAYNHWHAVAAFFKCFSYSRLVAVFGDVPYYETSFANSDLEAMYKDRDSRVFVMDKVYDMLKNEVLVNIRTNDGDNTLNRYVAAAFASRWMLFEGTWQKYHGGDQTVANKYLQLAKEAAEIVINSGKYAIDTPFRDVFGSQDLKGNKEAIMYRHYTFEMLKHHIASYSNGVESQAPAPNLALAKSFTCHI